MANAFYPDGTPIPADKMSEAIASGQARWRKGETVSFQSPDGQRYDVPAESAWDAISKGWAPESAEQAKQRDYEKTVGAGTGVLHTAERLLSLGTVGLSDVARDIVSDDLAGEQARRREEAFPVAGAVGTILGTLTPWGVEAAIAKGAAKGVAGLTARAVTAPARAVSRAGRALGDAAVSALPEATSLGGRAARSALRYGVEGAVEGAAFGAGRELSRQALGDDGYSVEKLLSAAGEGALFGGALGGATGGIGRVLGEGFVRAASARGGLRVAEKKAVTAAGALGGDLNKISTAGGAERINRIGRELLDRDLVSPLDSLAQRANKIGAAKAEVGEQLGGLYKGLDEAGATLEKAALRERVAVYLGKLREGVGPDIRLARRLEKDWVPSLEKAEGFQGLHKFMRRLDEDIYPAKGAEKRVLQGFRGEVKEALRAEIKRAAPDEAARLTRLDEAFSDLATISKISDKRVGQAAGNRSIGLTDTIAAAAGFASMGPGGLALALGNKALRSERTDAALAVALDRMRTSADRASLKLSSGVQKAARLEAQQVAYQLPPRAGLVANEYSARLEAPKQLNANPAAAAARLERVTAPLAEADPVLARRATTTLAEDLAWLQARAPKATVTDLLRPPRGKEVATRTPPSAMARYTRTARALADPVGEIEQLKEGKLTPEVVTVLQERRPAIREAVAREVLSAVTTLSQRGETPGYTARVQMSLVTGAPLDVTMQPEFIRMAQAVWRAKSEAALAPEPPPPRRVTPDRIRERTRALRTGSEELGDRSEG